MLSANILIAIQEMNEQGIDKKSQPARLMAKFGLNLDELLQHCRRLERASKSVDDRKRKQNSGFWPWPFGEIGRAHV